MVIEQQPVFSHTDNSQKKSHKCACEKCITCNSTGNRCYVNCDEFLDSFKLDSADYGREFSFWSCFCLPVVLVHQTFLCLPCTMYNICRNGCQSKDTNKNYIC
jgi:hypothetical protein